jgi:hypothetical protein
VGENEEVFGSYIDSGTSFPKGYDRVKPGDWSTSRNGLHEVLAVETNLQAAKY